MSFFAAPDRGGDSKQTTGTIAGLVCAAALFAVIVWSVYYLAFLQH